MGKLLIFKWSGVRSRADATPPAALETDGYEPVAVHPLYGSTLFCKEVADGIDLADVDLRDSLAGFRGAGDPRGALDRLPSGHRGPIGYRPLRELDGTAQVLALAALMFVLVLILLCGVGWRRMVGEAYLDGASAEVLR